MPSAKTLILPGIALAALAAAGTAFAAGTGDEPRQTPTVEHATISPFWEDEPMPPSAVETARQLEEDALSGTGMELPEDWDIVAAREELHDDRPVQVIRHQPGDYLLGAEHASVVIDEHGTVLGFTRLRAEENDGLIDAGEAEETALAFVERVAPDFADGASVAWVDRHDETVTDASGNEVVVSGMKVKMHHDNGLYGWVIVGSDGQVITFERDIAWDAGEGRRGTQMWLHDAWIAAYEGAGPQPDAPYALAGRED
jgi:hypothetical protein